MEKLKFNKIINFEPPRSRIKSCSIYIENKKTSKKVQSYLFKNGFSWSGGDQTELIPRIPFYIDIGAFNSRALTYSTNRPFAKEISFTDFKKRVENGRH